MMDQEHSEGALPPEWQRWRGRVDEKLDHVTTKIDRVEAKVDRIPEEITLRFRKVMDGSDRNEMSWRDFATKVLLPLLLGVALAVFGLLVSRAG